jgi:hypothetical protein
VVVLGIVSLAGGEKTRVLYKRTASFLL